MTVCSGIAPPPGVTPALSSDKPEGLLLRQASVRAFGRARIQPGEQRITHLLAVDQVDHDRRRPVAHLERPLADLDMAATGLERLHLRRQRVAGDNDELLTL